MRIIGGEWRGRRIGVPRGDRVRPTADRVREAWMSIVAREIPGARVLDLFAGSGALGLEALSRGAASAEFVELAPQSLRALGENIALLGAGPAARVRRGDALRFLDTVAPRAYDLAFADPPYALGMAEQVAARWLETRFARVLGIEHPVRAPMPPGGDMRRYGDTAITLFRDANE